MIDYSNLPKEYQELYDSLNSEYLLYCVENGKEEEWNEKYTLYLDYGLKACGLDKNTTYYFELFSKKFETADGVFSQPHLLRPNLQDIQIPDGKEIIFRRLHLEGANFYGVTLQNVGFEKCNLSGSTFYDAKLSDVSFYNDSCLDNCNFSSATLKEVDFRYTYITYSAFNYADFEQVRMFRVKLRNSHFIQANLTNCRIEMSTIRECYFGYSCIDGTTRIIHNDIDSLTNFTGVGLSGICMDEEEKVILESNIRRIHWNYWYKKEKFREFLFSKKTGLVKPSPLTIDLEEGKSFEEIGKMTPLRKCVKAVEMLCVDTPVKLFWWISDYGSSTKRTIFAFIALNLLAFVAYGILLLVGISSPLHSGGFFQMLFQTLLIPFGIGEVNLDGVHLAFLIVMFLQVIGGYVILAALVTRFAVLFQSRSP